MFELRLSPSSLIETLSRVLQIKHDDISFVHNHKPAMFSAQTQSNPNNNRKKKKMKVEVVDH